MTAPAKCCSSHVPQPPDQQPRPAPWLGEDRTLASCCDPNDCGPCCPNCPTCPTEQALRRKRQFVVGDRVRYSNGHDGPELGTVTSVGSTVVFVRYDANPHTASGTATRPEDLEKVQ